MSSPECSAKYPEDASPTIQDEFGFAFLKDGYAPVLPQFLEAVGEQGLHPVHVTATRLCPDVVDYIYRDSLREPFYPIMKHFLGERAILAIVMECEDKDTPPQPILNALKHGKDGLPNLRTRFQYRQDVVGDEEFAQWCEGLHPRQDALTVRLTQRNVFHAADDQRDATETFLTLWKKEPEFYRPNPSTLPNELFRLIERLSEMQYDEMRT